ncbi:MAG: ribosome maturation factor RimM [Kaiparowitsia implicata GSE-PSE-MK54-09C]|jgi:16S rRNA processing protein RimM|nr:ribosome maturation factor RimM [Kaiparowitsia implicata GSE-PSE-MK54-09C]
MATSNLDGWLTIGKIVGVQGLKGELRVYPDTDFPERFEHPGQRWLLRSDAAEPQAIELLAGRFMQGKGLYVVRLAGIDDRSQADELRNALLLVPEGDRPPLEDDEYHLVDLIGLEVFDQATQALIGTVISIIPAGNDLLEVKLTTPRPKHPTALIPFVKAIVPVVDLDNRRVEVIPPAGLLDL